MRILAFILAAFQLSVGLGLAQGVERVRLDLLVCIGTASPETLIPPSLFRETFKQGDEVPTDGLLILQPALVVSVSRRLQLGVEVPVGVAFNPAAPLAGAPYARAGVGDARAFVSAVLLDERRLAPSVHTTAYTSFESATLPHLASPRIVSGRIVAYKTLHPRLRVAGSVAYGDDINGESSRMMEPLRSAGAALELGISSAWLLNLSVDDVRGGALRVGDARVSTVRDLQAHVTFARFQYGRQRVALMLSGYGLRASKPLLLVGVRFPLASIGSVGEF
jgi:hypothetical protein